jgi:4a-hydroxytetrahydrobiopterin dehydratase
MSDTLSDAAIAERLTDGWERDGDEIVRQYAFDDYLTAAAFVGEVAEAADEAFHHPETILRFREVEVRLTNHEAGGITDADFELAATFDEAYADVGTGGD